MTINLWVNGEEYVAHSDKTIGVENPATGKVVDQLALADKHCLDRVVEIAREAQKEWGRTALAKRVDIMFKFRQLVIDHQDEIADAIVREGGKTHGDALGEIARGRETIDFACGINAALKGEFTDQASAGVDVHTLRQPVGVVAGICPFNFPAMVPMWMHPVALATGNAFILKVASVVPNSESLSRKAFLSSPKPHCKCAVMASVMCTISLRVINATVITTMSQAITSFLTATDNPMAGHNLVTVLTTISGEMVMCSEKTAQYPQPCKTPSIVFTITTPTGGNTSSKLVKSPRATSTLAAALTMPAIS